MVSDRLGVGLAFHGGFHVYPVFVHHVFDDSSRHLVCYQGLVELWVHVFFDVVSPVLRWWEGWAVV